MGCTWKGSLSGWEWSERTEGTLQFAPSWGISQNNRRVAIERCEADGSNSELHSGHHAGPAARPYCAQILMGIHRGVLDADFIVKVRARAASAGSYIADHISAMDCFSFGGCVSRHVSEESCDSVAVIEDDRSSIAGDVGSGSDPAIGWCDDGRSKRRRNIYTGMEGAFTVERVTPLAE